MAPTRLTTEYREFLRLLNAHRVEYLLVGGFAVGVHGFPRATVDLDIWFSASQENTARLLAVLEEFGFGSTGIDAERLQAPGRIFRLGIAPNRIELMNQIDGVDFDSCWKRMTQVQLDGIEVPIISLEDLKANKRASGRYKDLNDLENLP